MIPHINSRSAGKRFCTSGRAKYALIAGISADVAAPTTQLPANEGSSNANKGVFSREKPVVMYGTSILQGGCANRPGMAHTNIISRRLDREVINLGFSGNALLDMEIAELMASVEDPGLYVLDYAPNAYADMIDANGETFFRVIRDAHPDVPVIFIEDVIFPHTLFDKEILAEVTLKNEAQKRLFLKLKKAGEKNIYYIAAEGMIGDDGEATVDAIHFTDLGMMRYVDHVLPTIQKALKKSRK